MPRRRFNNGTQQTDQMDKRSYDSHGRRVALATSTQSKDWLNHWGITRSRAQVHQGYTDHSL